MSKQSKAAVLCLTLILVIGFTVLGVAAAKKVSTLPLGSQVLTDTVDEERQSVGMVNFLVIGVDGSAKLSDTIMLFSYDGYSNRINILSMPRDTQVIMDGTKQKLNAAMNVGYQNVERGIDKEWEEELIRQVRNLTGLPVHYFLTVDFDGFKEIIEALDGVDFDVPYDMDYDDPAQDLHIHLQAGFQHLDGQAAHDFVRFRQNNAWITPRWPGEYISGDEGRIYWQQKFMKELIRQKARPQYFAKIDKLYDVVVDNVRTNYTIQDLLKHIDILQAIQPDQIGSYKLPGESKYVEEEALWWYLYDPQATEQLIQDVFLPRSAEEWAAEQTAGETGDVAAGTAQTASPTASPTTTPAPTQAPASKGEQEDLPPIRTPVPKQTTAPARTATPAR